jgi:hypothetical protein
LKITIQKSEISQNLEVENFFLQSQIQNQKSKSPRLFDDLGLFEQKITFGSGFFK